MQLRLSDASIWVCNEPVDFRKSINGLCGIVVEQFEQTPSENIFVFYNRARDKVKLLGWHHNGFVLVYKRLERGRFCFSRDKDGIAQINAEQLSWLLVGLDWLQISACKDLSFEDYF